MIDKEEINNVNSREIPDYVGEFRLPRVAQPGGGRNEMIELILKYKEPIIESAGSVLVSSPQVLKCLHEYGHLKHVLRSNGVGDVLGSKKFKLPYVSRKGKRLYLIPAVSWDAGVLAAFFALPAIEQVSKIRSLEKELLEINQDTAEHSVDKVSEVAAACSGAAKLEESEAGGFTPVVFADEDEDLSELLAEGLVK